MRRAVERPVRHDLAPPTRRRGARGRARPAIAATRPPRAPNELLRAALARSPGWVVAVVVHLIGFVALSFWTIARVISEPERTILVTLGPAREDVVLPPGAPPTEATGIDVGAATWRAGAADVDLCRPFQEAFGDLGQGLAGEVGALGLGGGGGGGAVGGERGGSRSGAGGPTRASDAGMGRALDWLARHRTKDGAWAKVPPDHGRGGALAANGDSACTSLALLCFLAADDGQGGPYRDLIREGLAWLAGRVGKSAEVDGRRRGYYQAVTLLALAEGLSRRKDDARLRGAVERLAETVQQWQDPVGGGWRYKPQEPGDTSVTCWMLLGLKSAEHAGVRVHPSTWAGAARFIEAVSRVKPGYTAYMADWDVPDDGSGLGMHATGLFLRVLFGESPATERNEVAAGLCMKLPEVLREGVDRYAVYYTALAMYQVGGAAWRELNPQLRDGVVAAQRRDGGCEDGSWADDQGWMQDDVFLSTCFATLTLETYYRYLPVHDETGPATVGAGLTPGERLLLEAGDLFARAQRSTDPTALLAAEARFEEAIAAVDSGARSARRAQLVQRARAGLVEVAAAGLAPTQVVARSDTYLAGLGRSARPDERVLRLRRLALCELAMARTSAAVRDERPGEVNAPARRLADETLRQAIEACHAEAAVTTTPSAKGAAEGAAVTLEDVRRRLALVLASEAAVASAKASLSRPAPDAPVDDLERSVVDAVALRAQRAFADAARLNDAATLERAEADSAWLEGRDLPRRLRAGDQAWWDDALRAMAWPRLVALVRLGREDAALAALEALRARWPAERADERLALERTLLLRRAVSASATPGERARLTELLAAWVQGAPGTDEAPWLLVADLLASAERPVEAARALDRALAGPLTDEQRTQATLLRARLRRLLGHLVEAEGDLLALERLGLIDRADVRLERCALLRAQGRGAEALGRYEAIARALGVERPAPWWDAVEGIARTLLELRRTREARDVLEGVVRRDRTFGGDPVRADRFTRLMVTASR